MTMSSEAIEPAASTPDVRPVSAGERILSLDALRGIAVLGILLMNITAFALPWPAYYNPVVWGGHTGADLWAWITTEMLFEGTMRTIFSMLFGAGVIIFTTRAETRNPALAADLFYRRTILLIGFGLVNAYILLWPGDILYAYGVAGLFLFPLRSLSGRTLVILGTSVLMVSGVVGASMDQHSYRSARVAGLEAIAHREAGETLSHEQVRAIRDWEDKQEEYEPSREKLEETVHAMRGSYPSIFTRLVPINVSVQSFEYYTFGFWDSISMMLVGMGLMKFGVFSGARSPRFYIMCMAIGYTVGLAVNAHETRLIMTRGFTAEAVFESWTTYNIGRLFVAMGHIGLFMLLVRRAFLHRIVRRLSAVGQMALTNYLSQTVLCNLVFLGVGLGLFGTVNRASIYLVVLAVWALQLLWSPWWLARFRFGPAEWLWRSLTYGRTPTMRREPVVVSAVSPGAVAE